MMTLKEKLVNLVNWKKQLAINLAAKGVSATENEKLNTLVPKVLEISGASETQIKYADPSTEMVHVVPDEGKLLEEVWINPIQTQTKTITPSTSKQTVTPDAGYFLSSVVVNAERGNSVLRNHLIFRKEKGTYTAGNTANNYTDAVSLSVTASTATHIFVFAPNVYRLIVQHSTNGTTWNNLQTVYATNGVVAIDIATAYKHFRFNFSATINTNDIVIYYGYVTVYRQ